MMEKTTKAQSSVHWNQIRVNLPEDFYTLLRQRAASHHRSLSAEALQLMRVGLAHVKPQENIAGEVKNLDRYVRLHLEPLVFIAAMDAAFNAENWQQQAWMLHEHQYGEDKKPRHLIKNISRCCGNARRNAYNGSCGIAICRHVMTILRRTNNDGAR